MHMVGKHRGALLLDMGAMELLDQIMTIKNIVTQHQGAGLAIHKFFTYCESLRQTIRAGLHCVFNMHSPL